MNDPVGVSKIDVIKDKIDEIIQIWKSSAKRVWAGAVYFMVQSVDLLINFIESLPEPLPGEDKKATVLAAMDKLFDAIITPLMPFLLRPLTSRFKRFFVYTVISIVIDWIVSKYNNSHWVAENADVKKVFNIA